MCIYLVVWVERGPSKCNMVAILKEFQLRLDLDLLVWVQDEKQQSQVLENTRDGLEIKNQAGGEATTFQNSPCVSAEDSASSLNELSGDDNIH